MAVHSRGHTHRGRGYCTPTASLDGVFGASLASHRFLLELFPRQHDRDGMRAAARLHQALYVPVHARTHTTQRSAAHTGRACAASRGGPRGTNGGKQAYLLICPRSNGQPASQPARRVSLG